MKFIVTVLAIAALSVVSAARAQEESPAPASSPEVQDQAAPLVEAPSTLRDASPSPSPAEKSTSAPSPKAEKKEAAATASASPEKKSSSSAAEKKSSATASTGPDKGSPETNVKRLESEWETAVMKHDLGFIQTRVADDFMGVSSKGKRMNKSGLMKEFKADSDTYSTAKSSGVTVRALTPNVAVASGTAKEVGKTKDGKAFNRSYVWTDTWMMRGDQWQCVASQVMVAPSR